MTDGMNRPALAETLAADARNAAGATALGAAQGAVAGGAAGAAVGAAKGLLLTASRSRTGWYVAAAVVIALVVTQAIVAVQVASALTLIATAMSSTDRQAATASATTSGVDEEDILAALELVDGSSVPWEIAASAKQETGDDLDVDATERALDVHDPGARHRNISAGAAYSSDSASRSVVDAAAAATTERVWVETLNDVIQQGDETSLAIYSQALTWHLGQSFGRCTDELGNGGDGTSEALDAEQLANSAIIVAVAKGAFDGANLQRQAAIIAVVTAAQESSLRNIDYGDRDSVGLFQQRPSQGWGTVAQLMDPVYSSTAFYAALSKLDGWPTMPVGEAAQAVQISAFPDEYAKWEQTARVTVAAQFAEVEAIAPSDEGGDIAAPGEGGVVGSVLCVGGNLIVSGDTVGPVVNYVLTSRFGPRVAPTTGASTNHLGVDLAIDGCLWSPPVLEPIYAVQAGTVTRAQPLGNYGNLVEIDHGGGFVTRYAHLHPNTTVVSAGEAVEVGQVIAAMGNTGVSSGCHLHFETIIDGRHENPEIVMLRLGVIL